MKIAILYTTRTGTTEECARLLAKELYPHEVSLFNIKSQSVNIDEYDRIIIGFPIRMGKIESLMRKFLNKNKDILQGHSVSYYICCGFIDCFDDYVENALLKVIGNCADKVACLGGSLDDSKAKGWDRIVIRAVRDEILGGGDNADQRDDMQLPTILDENIVQFAEAIKKEF